jgi:anti-sigma regulatory factor (Ser/Thr protein kinase)
MRPAQPSATDGASEALPGGAIRSGPRAPFDFSVATGPAAPRAARAAMRTWMGRPPTNKLLTDALMVIGELVANSVRHAHAPADSAIGVHAEMRAEVLFLEVTDAGVSGAVARRRPDLTNGGGFGLNLVATLSRRWGVARGPGTRVWAELAFAPAA